MNPFSIPGAGAIPAPPLCPWADGTSEHENYYVAVDNTQRAFEAFEAALTDSQDVLRVGWFVLATGGEGCGKSSLVNRCVHALHKRLTAESLNVTIASATTRPERASTTHQRMESVCQYVIDLPEVAALLSPDLVERLDECCSNPARFYRRLGDALPDNRVLVVLLPPSELAEEVRRYVELSRSKIVFFAESSDDDVAKDAAALTSAQARITTLAVNPLVDGDGRCFSKARMNRHDGGGPKVDAEAAERMVAACLSGRGLPIGRLQSLLYEAYEEALARPEPDQVLITYEYLADYVVRSVLGSP